MPTSQETRNDGPPSSQAPNGRSAEAKSQTHHRVVIVGGGTAGIAVAARLRRADRGLDVAIIEPSTKHYYQPLWTLVGGGVFPRAESERSEASLIPAGAQWIRDSVSAFEPEENRVRTAGGLVVSYDYLVVAPGLQLDWDKIEGLPGAVGHDGVCSNYAYEYVSSTWDAIRSFRGGTAIFTMPSTPIKCGGAPQKIMYLADDHFRRAGVRGQTRIIFACGIDSIFAVKKYADALTRVAERKGIELCFRHNMVAIDAANRKAVFEQLDGGGSVTLDYDMIHVTPPMSAPDVVKHSPLVNDGGWVDVHKHTLQHTRYANVYGLGDASSLPTSKTGAAIRKQAPVVAANLMATMRGQDAVGHYDGYTSCPLVTGYGKLILAEFDYDKQPAETFPFDQSKERRSMYLLKAYGLPRMYWHGMMRGLM